MATLRIGIRAIVLFSIIFIILNVVAEAAGKGGGVAPNGGRVRLKETIFNVMQYGAKPGKGLNTQAFMKAWIAACHWRERSRLFIPNGDYVVGAAVFQGPCNAPSITVQLKGTLKASTDLSEYTNGQWLEFESVSNLQLTGGGTLDGQGPQAWEYNDCKKNPSCERLPMSLRLSKLKNSNIRNIKSVNPMGFHIKLSNCDNVGIQAVTLTAPADSPNTDGINIGASNAISISRSLIQTGDDCVSMLSGSTNIQVSQVTCGPGHGISIGSLGKRVTETNVEGITVTNCTLSNTDNGVRIKTWNDSPPLKASRITFQDIIMNNVKNPIIIDQNYCDSSSCKKKAPSKVKISDVHFTNIRGTSSSPVAVSIMCSQSHPCENVQLANVNLRNVGRLPAAGGKAFECSNAKIGYSGVQIPPPCKG